MFPADLLHLEGWVPIPPNSLMVIFNMPCFELATPMCLIHLCQETTFLWRYLLYIYRKIHFLAVPLKPVRSMYDSISTFWQM